MRKMQVRPSIVLSIVLILATLMAASGAPLAAQGPKHPASPSAAPGVKRLNTPPEPAPGAPAPAITTSGPAGVPGALRLPTPLDGTGLKAIAPSGSAARPILSEDWEGASGLSWVSYDYSNDGYERRWGVTDSAANSGDYSAWVAAGGADWVDSSVWLYPPNLSTWLINQNPIDLSRATMASADFMMYVDTEPGYDWIFVGASLDGQYFTGQWWTGFSGGWEYFLLDLSAFIGAPRVYVGWYFFSDQDDAGVYEGVWVDDIDVWATVDAPPPAGEDKLQNGGFELGNLSGWSTSPGAAITVRPLQNPVSGQYVARMGGANSANQQLYQAVALPNVDALAARLSFWVNAYGDEVSYGNDQACAGIYDAARTNLLLDLGCLDGTEVYGRTFDAGQWWPVEYEFDGNEWQALRGQTVSVVFSVVTNGSQPTTLLLDDVSLVVVTGVGAVGDGYEPNNSLAQATAITFGTPLKGLTIDPDRDTDYFKFTASANDTIIVDVDAASQGSPLDAVARLLNSAGGAVCENDDDGNTTDPYLSCRVTAAGTYYAVISSYDGAGDRSYAYTLTVSRRPASDPQPTRTVTPQPTPTLVPSPVPTGAVTPEAGRTWTAILYLDGDNNLCDFSTPVLQRLDRELNAKVGPGGFLNVVVLFDANPQYCGGTGGTVRYVVQPNGAYTANVNRWDMGELNMGDPQTLVNFGTWAMRNYPADHYFLAIEDHGNGIEGIAWDDTSNGDHITNPELVAALKQITDNGAKKIDLLAYEACLMGMYETAFDARQYADYILFFQSISWANDASYPSYMKDARFARTTTARQFGDIVFEVYYDAVTNPYAISIIDTSKVAAVHTAVNTWANALKSKVGTQRAAMGNARSAAQKIEVDQDWQITDRDFYLDLWDLADRMAAQGVAAAESNQVKTAVQAAVLRTAYRPPTIQRAGLNYARAKGLSIYWPLSASGPYGAYVNGKIFTTTADGTWDEFLEVYLGGRPRTGLPYEPPRVDRPRASGSYVVVLPIVRR
ncbi:MAG: clostripain-related cysteine peptidase [Chloroflexota bacterium]